MNQGPLGLPTPMTATVISCLQDRPERPKHSDAASQPVRHGISGQSHRVGKTQAHCAENGKGDGNEPGVDLEHFPKKQGRARQVVLPFEDGHEKQIQHSDS